MAILFHFADTFPKNIQARVSKIIRGKKKIIATWITDVIHSEKKECGNINIIFCTNAYLLPLNKKYLHHSYYTDVITFPYDDANDLSGDIFISVEQVWLNAERFHTTYQEELLRVIIHGILHLIGYNDLTDHQRMHMHVLEDKALEKILEWFD